MIFVILGTHELPFTRLLNEVERIKKSGFLKDEIVVQSGNTKYNSHYMTLIPFMSYEEMDKLYNKARLIITHAGTGSVITGLKKSKKVIAAARLKKYGEHNDDHQLELVSVFEKQGHILSWNEGENLEKVIIEAEDFEPKPFRSGKDKMLKILYDFIEQK
ncbi:UDP-N-acetylglucosamine transferase subunit ALG13 [Salinibacillus kushneri]|uniref:UDP-N-acetylglucosamine transferase subunit ALG13 n=1 Tax=Salinibacillus kushneri TaxID=237682 RepID=A0A1I0D0W1_9BACI|nr:PssE/Cps14G family polysaccharide biosynthesis glycosyltransferase [Salinibacillus kushneri]SET25707.1 UDP-N-acetylglucosamine transferase subunit ALG13 [Salinibacillus kushneri]